MSQPPNVIDELSEMASHGSGPSEAKLWNFRTLVGRSLRGGLPSAALVLSMSMLTAIILVLLVTTVAQALPLSQSDAWQRTAWSRWNTSPDLSVGDQQMQYAELPQLDALTPTPAQIDTAYAAAWTPQP